MLTVHYCNEKITNFTLFFSTSDLVELEPAPLQFAVNVTLNLSNVEIFRTEKASFLVTVPFPSSLAPYAFW